MTPRAPLFAMLALFAVGSCDGERHDGDAHAVIGPQGGTLVVADSASPIDGVAVEIPAGALARDANVSLLARADASGLPDLPTGLAAFEPIVELVSDVPFERDVRMVFPIRGAGTEVDRVPSGFHPGAGGDGWQVTLAEHLDGDSFSVRTRFVGIWRWGVTLVDEVEYDTLKPALETIYGVDEIGLMEAGGRAKFDELVGDLPTDQEAWSDCDTIELIVEIIAGARDALAADVEAILAQVCGGCVITAGAFVDELLDFLEAKIKHWLYDLLVEAAAPNFILEILGKMAVYAYYQSVLDGLTCDFECLAAENPPGLWLAAGSYLVCDVALAFVAFGVQFTECPPVEL